MKMRIFIGHLVSEQLKKDIALWEQPYSQIPISWTPSKKLHITIVPPWYADEKEIKDIIQKMKNFTIYIHAFSMSFTTIEVSPTSHSPRLLWVRNHVNKELNILKEKLCKELSLPFSQLTIPHITLAKLPSQEYADQIPSQNTLWKEYISSFSLIESRLSSKGAVYKTLVTKNL